MTHFKLKWIHSSCHSFQRISNFLHFNIYYWARLILIILACEVGEACTWHNGTQVLHSFGIDNTNIWWPNLAALGLFGLVMCVIALSCLKCRVLR